MGSYFVQYPHQGLLEFTLTRQIEELWPSILSERQYRPDSRIHAQMEFESGSEFHKAFSKFMKNFLKDQKGGRRKCSKPKR